jgi:hypothetical protein
MTKGVRLFLLLALGSLVSCVGGPKIKFDKLPSKEFVLTSVSFITNVAIYSENVNTVMPKLPFREIADRMEAEHGVRIDTSFFSEETISANIKQTDTLKLRDGYTGSYFNRQEKFIEIPVYGVSFDTDKTQTVRFEFIRGAAAPEMNVTVTFRVGEGEEITSQNQHESLPYWSPDPVIVDTSKAAVVRLHRLLSVMYVDYDPGILYFPNNMAGERSFYVVPDAEHDIICRYTGGKNMIINDLHWRGKLEAGKRYVISSDYSGNADLKITEERP